jgi:hypothetical protein
VKNALGLGFYFVAVNGLALMSVVWAVVSFGRGEYPTTVVVVGIALGFVGIESALVLTLAGKVKPRIAVIDRETTIRPDLTVDRLLSSATVAVVVAVAVYAVFSLRNQIDIPLPYGSQRMWSIAAIGIALTGFANLWSLFRRGGNSFLRLSPDGFEFGQGVSSVRGEWNDVVDFADRRVGKARPVRGTLFVEFGDGRVRTQAIDSYTPKGEALRRLVRYYWINPDKRDELATGRTVERLNEFEGKS